MTPEAMHHPRPLYGVKEGDTITRSMFGLLFWPVMAFGLGAKFAISYFRDNETVWPVLIASLLCLAVGDVLAEIRGLKENPHA